MTTSNVEVKLELGHRATVREYVTEDGFTHDWTVYVRGPDSCNIHHFVEKVIFNLHRDFAKPKRVVKEPPYEVSESGYGSFIMEIEVFFKTKEEPKRLEFNYDLFLKTNTPVNHCRIEKLTFQNPTEDFRKKLMKAGGIFVDPLAAHHHQVTSTPNLSTGTSSSQGNNKKNFGQKTPKLSNSSSSLPTSSSSSAAPLKDATSLSNKNSQLKKHSNSSNKSSSTSGKESSKSGESSLFNNVSVVKDVNKSQIKEKIFAKKSTSPDSPHSGQKKKKRSSPSPLPHGTVKTKEIKESEPKADKKTGIVKVKSEKKEKTKNSEGYSHDNKSDSKSLKELIPLKKLKQEDRPTASSPSLSTNSSFGSNNDVSRSNFTPPVPKVTYEAEGGEESRSSTSSFSSMHKYKGSGPLGALMEEFVNEQGDQDDVLSPLSSDESPPNQFVKQEAQPAPFKFSPNDIKPFSKPPQKHKTSSGKTKAKEAKSKDSKSRKTGEHKVKKSSEKEPATATAEPAFNHPRPLQLSEITEEYIAELQDLQRRIMLLKDPKHLQQIVNVIEETGRYQVTSSTFDFDLCLLDKRTVKKLQSCFAVNA